MSCCDYGKCNNGWGCPVRSTLITTNSDHTLNDDLAEYDDIAPVGPESMQTAALVFGVVCAIALICVAAIIYG